MLNETEEKSGWIAAFPSARTPDGYDDLRTLIDDALEIMSGAGSRLVTRTITLRLLEPRTT